MEIESSVIEQTGCVIIAEYLGQTKTIISDYKLETTDLLSELSTMFGINIDEILLTDIKIQYVFVER